MLALRRGRNPTAAAVERHRVGPALGDSRAPVNCQSTNRFCKGANDGMDRLLLPVTPRCACLFIAPCSDRPRVGCAGRCRQRIVGHAARAPCRVGVPENSRERMSEAARRELVVDKNHQA